MPGRRRTLALLAFVLGSLLLLPSGAAAQTGSVLRARIDGPITPVIADHVADAVAAAADGGHSALLLEMDTPGGLDSSMRSIVKDLLGSPVPVIVYVAPAGARAASAGAIITFAAHVAAMAPGTNIGAATPIDLEGGEVLDKVVNDAVAYVTAIAEERGRDVDFAVDTVRDGRSASATEALEVGAVDLVAPDRATLLDELDGRTVVLADGTERTLATAQAPVTEFEMTGVRSLLQRLADPNLAFLFISIGSLAVIYGGRAARARDRPVRRRVVRPRRRCVRRRRHAGADRRRGPAVPATHRHRRRPVVPAARPPARGRRCGGRRPAGLQDPARAGVHRRQRHDGRRPWDRPDRR
jgi:membrane-bound ClpP family serine protease